MIWNDWWTDDDQTPRAASDLPLPPDGRHTGEITRVEIKDLKFKVSERNGSGTSLVVEVTIPQYRPVEAIIPAQYRGLIESICRAARVDLPDPNAEWQCDELIAQIVAIDTILGIGKTGREYVRIDKWHPGSEPLPKARPARTPAAQIEAVGQGGSGDDIPF
ncbi:MAG: hypothetical protein HQ464_02500 [Planctomycetes bacterium]|nr:hypothetical protein [Planctomycetota bacterium]